MNAESLDIDGQRDREERRDDAEKTLVEECIRKTRRFLDDGIEVIGGMTVAAGVCGKDRSDLRRALNNEPQYPLALKHAIAIGARIARHNPSAATKIGAAIVRPLELLVFPRVTLKVEERAARLETRLRTIAASMGVDPDQFVEDALGGNR
jgi:hypothetical protein